MNSLLELDPGLAAVVDPDFKIEYYQVSHYDDLNRYQPHEADWPVLMRASGRFAQYGARVEISIERHPIIRYTPTGAWIATHGGKKFVSLRSGKQWASATEAEAIDQLWHRKRTQVRILESRLAEAKEVEEILVKHFDKKPPAPRPRYYASEWDGY